MVLSALGFTSDPLDNNPNAGASSAAAGGLSIEAMFQQIMGAVQKSVSWFLKGMDRLLTQIGAHSNPRSRSCATSAQTCARPTRRSSVRCGRASRCVPIYQLAKSPLRSSPSRARRPATTLDLRRRVDSRLRRRDPLACAPRLPF
jgi:hypothetical protein